MNAKLTPIIEQFTLVDGSQQNSPHNQSAVRAPKDTAMAKGNLFVLVEVQGDAAGLDLIEKRLLALVRDTYYPARGGITAGLRRAVNTANQWLYQYNSANEDLLIGGVAAAVMREDDLFIAQIGPAAIFSSLNNFIRRHPEKSAWLDGDRGQSDDYAPALGVHHFVEPYITHLQLQPGDAVILSDSQLAGQVSTQQVSQTLAAQKAGTIARKLAQTAHSRSASALVVQFNQGKDLKPALGALMDKLPVSMGGASTATDSAEKGFHFALPAAMPRPKLPGFARRQPDPAPQQAACFDDDEFYAADDDFDTVGDNERDEFEGQSPFSRIWQLLTAAVVGTIAFLGGGLHTILQLALPGSPTDEASLKQAGRQAQPLAGKQPSRRALLYVAFGLPVLALMVVLAMYWYKGYNKEQEYLTALNQAEQKYQQAQLSSPETARALLTEVDQHLDEAAAIKTDQKEITALHTVVDEQRDEINNVQRLYYVPELRNYTDAGTQLNNVVVQGVNVYVLDKGLNRVFQHTLDDIGDTLLPDEGSPMLVQQGQKVDDLAIEKLIDMVWMPSGGGRQTSDLLVLDRSGLIEFDPDWGAAAIAINGIETWKNPVAVGSYFGNFYVLDAGANQIYRYLPTANGYENPPDPYFAEGTIVNLSGVVDMAIDGAIYALHQDGRIQKFTGGQPVEFQITGLDEPFKNPTAIYTALDEEVQYLYIADAGNKRIVQLSKDGQFIRQFKPRVEDEIVFDNLQGLYVDEIGEKMYALNGNSLYAPNLPSAP
ncbi:MAG TPA: hypothetical protein G4N96_07495 [Chloroflexi bacterium]|nr:hypothetical protein [Chloroflexota bacterium]